MDVEFALKFKNSIIASYIVGIVSGMATFLITYNYALDGLEYNKIMRVIAELMFSLIIFGIITYFLLTSYSAVKTVFRSKYELVTLQYERDILIHVLKEKYQFDCNYNPRQSKKDK